MQRLRVYIDTSVLGGCLDPEFEDSSRALLDAANRGRIVLVVSDILIDELLLAPAGVQELFVSLPDHAFEAVEMSAESLALRDAYLEQGVVGPRSASDAHHVALATIARADMIVSWNFRHIVQFSKMRGFNSVNLREGYPTLAIHCPREVVADAEDGQSL